MSPGWISIIFTAVVSFVGLVLYIGNMRSTIDSLQKSEGKRDSKDEAVDKQVVDLLVTLKAFMSEQSQINKRVADMLDHLLTKVEATEKATIEGTAVISLLTEFLKKGKGPSGLNIEP